MVKTKKWHGNKTEFLVQVSDPVEVLSKKMDLFIQFVIGVLVIGFLALLLTVAGMVIETWRFNSTVYKESVQLKNQQELIENTIKVQSQIFKSMEEINRKLEK